VGAGAEALLALRDGEHTPAATAGALMASEFMLLIRSFLTAKPKT
jgi:hypothetical protein